MIVNDLCYLLPCISFGFKNDIYDVQLFSFRYLIDAFSFDLQTSKIKSTFT